MSLKISSTLVSSYASPARVSHRVGPHGGVLVSFKGGPWNGQTRRYRCNPQTVACVDDAHAKGMHGVYKTPRETWSDNTATQATAYWHDMPRKA